MAPASSHDSRDAGRSGADGMITGAIKRQSDDIGNDFWAGGVANPLAVVERITHLLFIQRLDEMRTLGNGAPPARH